MNGSGRAIGHAVYKSFSADLFFDQRSSPLPTRVNPFHAPRVTTTPLVRRRRRRSEATFAAGGPCLQRSSAIVCEDNSRFHSNYVWVDRPCEGRAPVLLGCTADRPVRETRSNFESIVRVVAPPPRCV